MIDVTLTWLYDACLFNSAAQVLLCQVGSPQSFSWRPGFNGTVDFSLNFPQQYVCCKISRSEMSAEMFTVWIVVV